MAESLDAFRSEVRAYLEANCPPEMRQPFQSEDDAPWGGRNFKWSAPQKAWLDAMAAKGWTVPTWPTEYGGGGLSKDEAKVLAEEMRRIKARPPLQSFGIWMLGPALLKYGSHEQKLEYLPPIARGEIRWCQGYSEPGAGSDLASLKTRADDHGDHWVVNGSKVWTSYADQADWIFCLVRTNFQAPKHEGISFILFDMTSEGVSVKPIELISGSSQFCETFFDNVRVPKSNLVGEKNEGWKIAKRLLQHERNMVAGMGSRGKSKNPEFTMENQAKIYLGDIDNKVSDVRVREKITQHKMDSQAFSLTLKRAALEAQTNSNPSPASSMFKYFGTELNKRRWEITMDIIGTQGLGWAGDHFSDRELMTTREWLRSKGNSIEGGTSEVQLNIVSKRVLKLPD